MTVLVMLTATGILASLLGCGPAPQKMSEGAILGGLVAFQATQGDKPISGARVQVVQDGQVVSSTVTTREGRFTITQLPPGDFNLVVETDDYAPYDLLEATGIPLNVQSFTNGREYVEVPVESRLTVLRGKVVTAAGEPVADVEVRTYPRTVKTTTGRDGVFEIRSGKFEPGVVYQVETQHADYDQARSEAFEPTPGEDNELADLTVPDRQRDVMVTGGEVDNTGRGAGGTTQGDK